VQVLFITNGAPYPNHKPSSMKKQINPTIKAHLIRSAFYVTLLLAVCAIPFALAQRNANKRSVAGKGRPITPAAAKTAAGGPRVAVSSTGAATALNPARAKSNRAAAAKNPSAPGALAGLGKQERVSQVPLKSGSHSAPMLRALRPPRTPQVVLYDQYDNPGANATLSATFTDFPNSSADLADDFVVPAGQTWNVESIDADGTYFNGPGPATDWNVFVYTDSGGFPATQIFSATNIPITQVGTTFTANLSPAAVLTAGTYWIEIQANMTFGTQGEWGWTDRTVQSNSGAAFRNPGGDFGCGTDWVRKPICVPTTDPDQVYRINGTTGGGGTPTPTPTATPTCTPGAPQWSEVAPLPFASRGPFVVSDGTFYYIGGGYDGFDVHTDLLRYDPVANNYTPLANAPDPFFLSQAVIFNNKIYSIAGFNLGGQSSTTRIYDIAANSWTTGTALPEPAGLSDAATGLDGGKIYIACGFNGSGASNTLHIYDIATDSWTTGASAPTAVYLPGFGAINGKFYVASGNNGVGEVPDLQIYDIASNTWSSGAPIPTPVTGPGSAVFDDGTGPKLYVFGGTAPFPVTTTITQIYDPATDSWSTGPSMVVAKLWFYGGPLDPTSILAPGGDSTPGIPFNDNQILAAGGGCVSPTPTPTPTATCPPGGPRGGAGAWTAGNPYPITDVRYGFAQTATHFYVFGGVSDGTRVNNVNRMDLSTGTWEPRAPMPFTSEAPTCALDESAGIVYCAEGDTGSGFASYDIASDSWTSLASIPGGDHYGSASGAFNGKVFVAGGTTSFSNAVQVYDIATNTWSAGTAAPSGYLLAGYHQVGQFLYVVGGWTGGGPTGLTTTMRLDMSSAPGVWENGPSFPQGRSDFGLAYDTGTNTLYALGGDLQGGGFFDSTNEVDELSLAGWPGGTWNPSPPDLPLPVRQANQAGFYGNGDIWSVGGLDGQTFQFLNEVWHRNNAGGGCVSPTPTPTPTATFTPTPTATATATPTPTATATATATATPTATRPPPTPRPRPTPYPRPTP
jgi:N-acetylneuraminic acid mutarotase